MTRQEISTTQQDQTSLVRYLTHQQDPKTRGLGEQYNRKADTVKVVGNHTSAIIVPWPSIGFHGSFSFSVRSRVPRFTDRIAADSQSAIRVYLRIVIASGITHLKVNIALTDVQ